MALKSVVFVGWAFLLWAWLIFHRIGRAVAVARATEDATAASFGKVFGIKPLPDAFEAKQIFAVVFHNREIS